MERTPAQKPAAPKKPLSKGGPAPAPARNAALRGKPFAQQSAELSPRSSAGRGAPGAGGDGPRAEPAPKPEHGTADQMKPLAGGTPFVKGEGDRGLVDPNDVAQGSLGDCYLIAALKSVARTDPGYILSMVKDNGDGTYTVTFHVDKKGLFAFGKERRQVTVSGNFAVDAAGTPRYAKAGDRATVDGQARVETWVMIVEKAWAAMGGSYKAIEGGNPGTAMEAITGEDSDSFDTDDKDDAGILQALKAAQEKKHPVTCYTPSKEGLGSGFDAWFEKAAAASVVANHAYSFKSVEGDRILLENPWGSHHPKALTAAEFRELYKAVQINAA